MDNFGFEEIANAELSAKLDLLFPNACSKQEIEHEGTIYRKRFRPRIKQGPRRRPCGKLGGGKVSAWDSYWEQKKLLTEFASTDAILNHLFPNVRSKEMVSYDGKRYRAVFWPVFSRSMKTIHRWEKSWDCLD